MSGGGPPIHAEVRVVSISGEALGTIIINISDDCDDVQFALEVGFNSSALYNPSIEVQETRIGPPRENPYTDVGLIFPITLDKNELFLCNTTLYGKSIRWYLMAGWFTVVVKIDPNTDFWKGGVLNCSICMEDITDDIHVLEPCRHIFHNACIQGWIQRHGKCPICRQPAGKKLTF